MTRFDNSPKNAARELALAELKRQINEQKARIDPRVLKIAEKAARLQQEQQEQAGKTPADNMVPYDREAAAEAVALFLKNSDDPEATQRRILALLRKGQN